MKLVVANKSARGILRLAERILFGCAALLLGYWGFVFVDTWMFQQRESQALDLRLKNASQARIASGPALPVTPSILPVPSPDGLIGRIEILRLGVSVVVVEGVGERALRRAVGHIPGTAMPGETGNIGIAAHRDTFFRPLRHILPDDVITLSTPGGEYRYRVVSTKIVKPRDIAVLDSDGTEILTLVTCYPFYFVGNAPDRFIVRAERMI